MREPSRPRPPAGTARPTVGWVTVTTLWADERLYCPVDAVPSTPARHFLNGRSDPGRTKLAIGVDLAVRAREASFPFRAVAADSAYGDQDGFRSELAGAGRRRAADAVLAAGTARGARLAYPVDRAAALVADLVQGAPAPAAAGPDGLGGGGPRPAPLQP
jgi:hypothetical protein